MKLAYLLSAVLAIIGTTRNSLARGETAHYSGELEVEAAAEAKQLVPKSDYVIELDRTVYHDVLKTHDMVFIEFYANWCAACHAMSSEFDAFAKAARKEYPQVAIARADITNVEYLSSSYMVSMLPELVFIRRPAPGATPEVRYVSANFTKSELLDYIGRGWAIDKPAGDYTTLWCTPTNFCGHLGGLIGEFVVYLDKHFNRFDIPPWAFMAAFVSVLYLVGQVLVGYLARLIRRKYRAQLNKKLDDAIQAAANGPSTPKAGSKASRQGSATKRAKSKTSKSD
ncbi:hypothetical protein H4S07_004284 [Coemansia furcata]|uniref:Uncharacterized protein n=1 Tax=Coemansia furcata TaxID=417177 RepID=A0ACC1LAE7_9FUNG|nr:hypothetical protein H4S07_004284 [Coemansia furcata]